MEAMLEADGYNEQEVATMLQQVLRALNYMHQNGVCHRDLRPENLMFHERTTMTNGLVKLIDFGAARRFKPGEVFRTQNLGAAAYAAPEIKAGNGYNELVDTWSLGCIGYIMLSGQEPPRRKDGKAQIHFEPAFLDHVTEDGRDFLTRLLTVDPTHRMKAEDALQHPWIVRQAKANKAPLQQNVISGLRNFSEMSALKKTALQVIAQRLSEDEISLLRNAFTQLDTNQDGVITFEELHENVSKLRPGDVPEDLRDVMRSLDVNGSMTIEYTEFLAASIQEKHYREDSLCWTAFQAFDLDGSGKICRKELSQVLKHTDMAELVGESDIDRILADIDGDDDDEIDFQEFLRMMRNRK
jgi:calcium-dependent protein kinase